MSEIRDYIASVEHPVTDVYFEKSSADGYAQLGLARFLVGLDCSDEEKVLKDKVCGLNGKYTILGTVLSADTVYVYTSYFVYRFMRAIGKTEEVKRILDKVEEIGTYAEGMVKYCDTETSYLVPNVTALAAEMYALDMNYDKVRFLVEALKIREIGGNWDYEDVRTGRAMRKEDSMHLCMMVYALRNAEKYNRIWTGDIVSKGFHTVREMNKDELQEGSIGWGIPWLMLASYGKDDELFHRAREDVIKSKINHKNFRVRAISALALAETE